MLLVFFWRDVDLECRGTAGVTPESATVTCRACQTWRIIRHWLVIDFRYKTDSCLLILQEDRGYKIESLAIGLN